MKVFFRTIIALTTLTAWGQQVDWIAGVRNKPFADVRQYNFAAQSPGGSVSVGSNTKTMSPCPLGVNGTDTKHYLYLSGGTGTAETIRIAGGTCTSGASSGTIVFTAANTHSGAYSIRSATAGITEAETVLKASTSASGGGQVFMPAGTYTIYGPIPWRQNVEFVGEGAATILVPATSSTIVFDADVPTKGSTQYTLTADNAVFRDFLIDAATHTGVNGVYGIRGTNETASTEVWSFWNVVVDGVVFNNVYNSIYLQRARGVTSNNCWLYENSRFVFTDSTINASYQSADIRVSQLSYSWHPMNGGGAVAVMTSSVLSFINSSLVWVQDSSLDLAGGATAYGITYSGTGEDFYLINTHIQNATTALFLTSQTISATDYYPGFIKIVGCSFDVVWGELIVITAGNSTTDTHQVAHVLIANNFFTGLLEASGSTPHFFNTSTYTKHVQFSNNLFRNLYGSQTQTAIVIGDNADDIVFSPTDRILNETGDSAGATGIFISTSALGVYGVDGVLITGVQTPVNDGDATVSSAATITLPVGRTFATITGTTGITSITAAAAGTRVLLLFTGNLTVTDGSNLKLAGNFVSGAGGASTLSLYCDGTNWIETARAVN